MKKNKNKTTRSESIENLPIGIHTRKSVQRKNLPLALEVLRDLGCCYGCFGLLRLWFSNFDQCKPIFRCPMTIFDLN